MQLNELKVGDTVWIFDENRRIYAKEGRGGPIWREHWTPQKIESETSRSWVLPWGEKLPKKGTTPFWVCLSELEINDKVYVHDNAYRIGCMVQSVKCAETLRKIEALLPDDKKQ